MLSISPPQLRASLYVVFLALIILVINAFLNEQQRQTLAFSEAELARNRFCDSLLARMETRKPQAVAFGHFERPAREETPMRLHSFDPHTVTAAEWTGMGLPEKVFRGLERYRSKGGRFRQAGQIRKLYHLDPKLAEALVPYVRVDTGKAAKPAWVKNTRSGPTPPFDLNQADTNQLKSVFGIGSKTALRIWKYRESLGGFLSPAQLYEIYRLDSLVVEELLRKSFLPANPLIRKVPLNTATEEELGKHPYIRRGLARILVAYRNQHGPYRSPEALDKIRILGENDKMRMLPYLDFSAP